MSHNHCVVHTFWLKGKIVECAVCCAYFLKAYGHFFCPLIMGFTCNGRFFCSIAYFGFWLWRVVQVLWQQWVRTSSDSLQKRHFSLKWSKLGFVIGDPNLATNAAIFPTKFACTHKTLSPPQYHVENKTVSRRQHTAPNTASRRDTKKLSEPVRWIRVWKTIDL